ncbi:MAG: futalosine hydrolase [Ginsengibacter sp.]
MDILLASATEFEVDFEKSQNLLSTNSSLTKLITGVGLPNAMYQLTRAILLTNYDFVIQAGIAGAADKLNLGTVVMINEDTFADAGIYENGTFSTFFDSGFADKDDFPFTNGWLRNDNLPELGMLHCRSVTVNTITDEKAIINYQNKRFNAAVESMEGAALHYVCLMNKVPFLQVRSISNMVGERDKSKWQMSTAINNLNEALPNIINSIINLR